jgi:tetratricopeptide (TPR) repeat protein
VIGRALASTCAALAVGFSFSSAAAQSASPQQDRVLVMPFENVNREASIFWLGEASAVLLADNLSGLGLSAIARPERRMAFERLQVPPSAVLSDATVIRIGQLVGAAQVIVGSLQLEGDVLVVRARKLALDVGRIEADVTERGPVAGLFPIFDRVAERLALRERDSGPPPRASGSERPPMAAFENFIKGILAETPATAAAYLNAALAGYPAYDRARLALWQAYSDQGDHQRAVAALEPIGASSPWSRRARFYRGLSELTLKKYDEAFVTYKALADQEATPAVLNNLGVVQLRRGGNLNSGLPSFYFDRAAQSDSGDPDYFFNLGYAYWQARDYPSAQHWLREAVRRSPADGDAHWVLGAVLVASGSPTEAAREKELATRLSSTYQEWQERPPGDQVPRGLERVKTEEIELPHARRLETKIVETSQRDQQELGAFYLERAKRLFQQENDREASVELERVLFLSPYLASAHVLLGRIHLRNGRVREAIDALKIAVWSSETAEARIVLAEAYLQADDRDEARVEAARALALDPASADAKRLVDMLKSP